MAEGAGRFRRQARRRDRHRRDRHPDHPDHRRPGRPSHGVPAHGQLGRAASQRQNRRRDAAKIKAGYPEIFARCRETFACFIHTPDPRGAFEVSDEEREADYERLYGERGFGIWVGNFNDILTDRKANATISDFVARKIRERVKNQAVAEKLIPEESRVRHAPAAARDLLLRGLQPGQCRAGRHQGDADRAVQPRGIKTSEKEYAFDIIIYATGFDAITGSFDKIDFRGAGGAQLKDNGTRARRPIWHHGPRISDHADADGAAHRARQYSAQHRIQRRLGHGSFVRDGERS